MSNNSGNTPIWCPRGPRRRGADASAPTDALVTDFELFQGTTAVSQADAESRRSTLFYGRRRDPLLRRMLALADVVAAGAVALSLAVGGEGTRAAVVALAFIPAWIVLAKVHGLYDRDQRTLRHLASDEFSSIFLWSLSGSALLVIFLDLVAGVSVTATIAVQSWLVVLMGAVILRSGMRVAWRKVTPPARTVIVGTGELAEATRRKLQLFGDIHVRVLAERADFSVEEFDGLAGWLGGVDRIILASQAIDEAMLVKLIGICRRDGLKLSVVPPVRGMFGTAVKLNHLADLPVVEYSTWDVSRSTQLLKRSLDIAVAGIALVVLSPLMLAIAVAVRATSQGGASFTQTRAGLDGKPFRMLKFRTMERGADLRIAEVVDIESLDEPSFKFRNDPRTTRVGRWLRRTSLDELPQLVNVLKGDMSLVGPRPEQVEVAALYRPEHRFRLSLRPGMTGPMQVFGRGNLSFDERLSLEREYIENLSLGRDLRIIAMTIPAVILGRGAF
jgi:exopolysaccharide biosynthesis polyprenyl glycosylphosphotransferase